MGRSRTGDHSQTFTRSHLMSRQPRPAPLTPGHATQTSRTPQIREPGTLIPKTAKAPTRINTNQLTNRIRKLGDESGGSPQRYRLASAPNQIPAKGRITARAVLAADSASPNV